jgi:hypothetical protein
LQLAAVVDRPARIESAGGHVAGSSLRGQVLEVSIDPAWAGMAQGSEIESELVEVLRAVHRAGAVGVTRLVDELVDPIPSFLTFWFSGSIPRLVGSTKSERNPGTQACRLARRRIPGPSSRYRAARQ